MLLIFMYLIALKLHVAPSFLDSIQSNGAVAYTASEIPLPLASPKQCHWMLLILSWCLDRALETAETKCSAVTGFVLLADPFETALCGI